MVLLVAFECLALFFIWWGGVVIALGNQPEQRRYSDRVERQRRADWFGNELEQRPSRAAILWTIAMIAALMVVVALTVHFGWGIKPVKV